jgi:hypothetical protein
MSNETKQVVLGAAVDSCGRVGAQLLAWRHGVEVHARLEDGSFCLLPLDWQELQTVLGDYATVTPKPRPERWFVHIEDCLRPWNMFDRLGPFGNAADAYGAANDWARDTAAGSNGILRIIYPGCLKSLLEGKWIDVRTQPGNVVHYRLTWRQETEAAS